MDKKNKPTRKTNSTLVVTIIFLALMLTAALTACSSKKNPSPSPEPTPTVTPSATAQTPTPTAGPSLEPTPEPTPETDDLTGKTPSLLTGLYIDEATAAKRPIAFVINNAILSIPQSGIGQADLYYEVLSEADITRIVAVYQNLTAEKIGSIRSSRDYFLNFALDNDAIYVHHGSSPIGYTALSNLKINNIDGMYYDGSTFWRDPDRWKIFSMREHSSFTSASNILSRITALGYRTEKADGYVGMFNFYQNGPSSLSANKTSKITIPYASSHKPYFEYDEETGLYKRFQFNAAHIDDASKEQLTVTNLIVQKVPSSLIPNDSEGRRAFSLIGSGSGYLFTNGTYETVTWTKTSSASPTEWFDANGNKLTLNPGKTWISVFSGNPEFN